MIPDSHAVNNNVTRTIENKVTTDEEKKLNEVIDKERVLFSTKTKFPFDLFPDEIAITLNNLLIRSHEFFKSGEVRTYEIADIKNIIVEHGPLFSTLIITLSSVSHTEIRIKHLEKTHAKEMRKIINGLLKAKKNHVDLTKIPFQTLLPKVEKLGEV